MSLASLVRKPGGSQAHLGRPCTSMLACALILAALSACLRPPAATPTPVPTPTEQPTPTLTPTLAPTPMAAPWTPGQLEIHLLDVQHGDSQLIISPTGETMLIDAGMAEYAPKIAEYVRQVLGVLEVDYLLLSHYHEDHICGVVPLLSYHRLEVRRAILDRGGDRNEWETPCYREYYDYLGDPGRRALRNRVRAGDEIDMGPEIKVEVLGVTDIDNRTSCGVPVVGLNDNDNCIVLWLSFGQFDYWTAGDLSGEDSSQTTDVESACARLVPRQADLYKADHHAIDWNSNANLMAALQPQVSIISLETLTSPDALQRMMEYGQVYGTNKLITLTSDRSPVFIQDSDDIVVISRDGIQFIVEGDLYTARP